VNIQQDNQTIQESTAPDQNVDQNVLEVVAQNVPTESVEQLSADPNPLGLGSFPSKEV